MFGVKLSNVLPTTPSGADVPSRLSCTFLVWGTHRGGSVHRACTERGVTDMTDLGCDLQLVNNEAMKSRDRGPGIT